MLRLTVLLLLLIHPGLALAQTVHPSQLNPRNAHVVSSTNSAAVVTVTGVPGRAARLISFKARCSGGTSTVTVTVDGSTVWATATGAIGSTDGGAIWIPAYLATVGKTLVVTLASCGSGNTGTLDAQVEQW